MRRETVKAELETKAYRVQWIASAYCCLWQGTSIDHCLNYQCTHDSC